MDVKCGKQGMLKLQKAHEYAARTFQGLPQQCQGIAATATLGWQDIECTVDKRRLMFLFTLFLYNYLFTLTYLCKHLLVLQSLSVPQQLVVPRTFHIQHVKNMTLYILNCRSIF